MTRPRGREAAFKTIAAFLLMAALYSFDVARAETNRVQLPPSLGSGPFTRLRAT